MQHKIGCLLSPYVYSESEPGRRAAAKLLTKDEARRIAANGATCLYSRSGQLNRLDDTRDHRSPAC
jgi:hypothetical protein